MRKLWYARQAEDWLEALPLGNGRLGAMVFGGVTDDTISFNEDTLWSGAPRAAEANREGVFEEARRLALAGEYRACEEWLEDKLTGAFSEGYLPLCDVRVQSGGQGACEGYSRDLRLDTAIASVEYVQNGARYAREAFVSKEHECFVTRIRCDRPGGVQLNISIDCQLQSAVRTEDGALVLTGVCPSHCEPNYRRVGADAAVVYADADEQKGMRFCAILRVLHKGGSLTAQGGALSLTGADEATLFFCARTSFAGYAKQPYTQGADEMAAARADMLGALAVPYDELKARHIADYRRLFDRVSFHLEGDDALDALDTETRLKRFAETNRDDGLCALLFDYGRYLLIASSRPGTQAANLQGIWNKEMRPPWSSNYTININTEMNYWPAEKLALPETHEPMIDLARDLTESGKAVAQAYYGARGAVAHHNTDVWRLANPVGMQDRGCAVYACWPFGLAWLCRHVYEHYAYSLDEGYLRGTAYPILRESARFLLDTLCEDERGYLVHAPSTSPENSFVFKDGKPCAVAKTTEMSMAITRELLENTLACERALGVRALSGEIEAALPRLAPSQIGTDGQLFEWSEEWQEHEPAHRHLSLLYALYPGDAFLRAEDSDTWLSACARVLARRAGDTRCTGWGLAWRVCCMARLRRGDDALRLLKGQLRYLPYASRGHDGGTYLNLFCAHPPFQIDGNFGAAAGIAEMLLTAYGDTIRLLPALPSEWQTGEITGLCAPRGLTVDIAFENGLLKRARVAAAKTLDAPVRVRYQNKTLVWNPKAGDCLDIDFGMLKEEQ